MKIRRRDFLKGAASVAAAGVVLGLPGISGGPAAAARRKKLKLCLHQSKDGKMIPAEKSNLQRVYFMDVDYNPLPVKTELTGEDGVVYAEEPSQPYKITALEWVDGFGVAYLVADNGGAGYRPGELGQEASLNELISRSRYQSVHSAAAQAKNSGVVLSPDVSRRLEAARGKLELLKPDMAPDSAAGLCWKALNESMWAGEMVAVERANHAIAKRGPRHGFLFGANAFGCLDPGEDYTKYFYDIFNYCTLPFYYRSFESVKGKPAWERLDRMVEWCKKGGITPKGHPLVWFHQAGTPDWLEDKSFDNVRSLHKHRIKRIVSRYKGQIDYWDVINEAHDFANTLNYSYDQLLDMTKMACETARAANPEAVTVVNCTVLWGEYAAPKTGDSLPDTLKHTPIQYVEDCIRSGFDFDVVGLQIYYQHRDLFEVDRMLERFARFGKPLHITEHAFSSDPAEDPKSHVKKAGGHWHGEYSQSIQADYICQLWTIAYSKDFLTAITYWDFADGRRHFWPNAGFLDAEMKPKESYYRLKSLIDSWQSA